MISLLVGTVFSHGQMSGNMNAEQQFIHSQIPLRISDALKHFNLEGKTTTYAMCPSCHKGYAPSFSLDSSQPIYPEHCSNVILEQGICGEALLDGGNNPQPLKPFVYHHLDDFVGSLLAREDLERYIDTACDDLKDSIDKGEEPHFVHDIFQASFLRTFKGPDGKLFIDRGDEGRLAFSICVDYFNVEGSRLRGRRTSSGMITMACLNLPFSIRYLPENMFLVGIVPGPREPTETAINYYLTPLVDDLIVFWEKGFHYSRTALHPDGRTVRGAIVVEVCDLPGSRQISGLAAHSHHLHFCNFCNFKDTDNQTEELLGKYDYETWTRKDVEELRRHAERWRDATSIEERNQIFEEAGVRYSVLWRLIYWDPTRQIVPDPMHTVLQGIVENHFRRVLKISKDQAKTKTPPAFSHVFRKPLPIGHPDFANLPKDKQFNKKQIKQIDQIHNLLTTPFSSENLTKSLKTKTKKCLLFVFQDLNLPRGTRETVAFYCDGLIRWVSLSTFFVDHGS
jgi:hypothetical protein